jgi:hypothetical protein
MDKHDRFTKRLLQASERSYRLGVAAGLAGGFVMGSGATIVIPLSEGIKA